MKVARMMLTMLNLMPHRFMMPRIQAQPTVRGRKANRESSNRPKDRQRKKNTTMLHT